MHCDAENKRLEGVAEAEWKEMMTNFTNLAERTSASDELASQIDDLLSDAQHCSVQWVHEKMRLNASFLQSRDLAAALGLDSSGEGEMQKIGRSATCRTPSTDRARFRAGAGGARRVAATARRGRALNAGGPSVFAGTMKILQHEEDEAGSAGGGKARGALVEKLQLLQARRRGHEEELSALQEEQQVVEAAVDSSAKFVADVLALEREERQVRCARA
jgi:hypothetical protein